jgi:hypothetical protein
MKNRKLPLIFLISTNIFVSGYHLLILFKLIDFKMVWGGRLHTTSEMYQFESFSLFINLLILSILLLDFKRNITKTYIQIIYWILAVMFILNTLGNVISVNYYEKIIFTPITLISSISCFMLISHKRKLIKQN